MAATDPLTLVNAAFLDNVVTGPGQLIYGGGGAALGEATLVGGLLANDLLMTGTSFVANVVAGFGGGLAASEASISGARFIGNAMTKYGWGGGLGAVWKFLDLGQPHPGQHVR